MARTDVFALKNSDLNAFLFADVGTELNGSELTILSVLARLGQDPWSEARRWAQLPKAAAIDCLTQCIALMPLTPDALAGARETASHLARLLPGQARTTGTATAARTSASPLQKWAAMALFCCALAVGIALNMGVVTRPAPTETAPPVAGLQHAP